MRFFCCSYPCRLPLHRLGIQHSPHCSPYLFMISGYFLCDDTGVIQTGHIKKIIKHMIPVIIFVNLIYFLYSLIPEPYGHLCKLDQLSSPDTWVLLIYPGSSFFHPGWYLDAYIIALCVIALLVKLHCDKLLYVWIFIITVR